MASVSTSSVSTTLSRRFRPGRPLHDCAPASLLPRGVYRDLRRSIFTSASFPPSRPPSFGACHHVYTIVAAHPRQVLSQPGPPAPAPPGPVSRPSRLAPPARRIPPGLCFRLLHLLIRLPLAFRAPLQDAVGVPAGSQEPTRGPYLARFSPQASGCHPRPFLPVGAASLAAPWESCSAPRQERHGLHCPLVPVAADLRRATDPIRGHLTRLLSLCTGPPSALRAV
jgi:hypothetical protein